MCLMFCEPLDWQYAKLPRQLVGSSVVDSVLVGEVLVGGSVRDGSVVYCDCS